MRTQIETTNSVDGMLEQGGVCGQIISYDATEIAKIMECDEAEAAEMDGDEIVPGTSNVTLRQYIEFNGIEGYVVRKGTKIE